MNRRYILFFMVCVFAFLLLFTQYNKGKITNILNEGNTANKHSYILRTVNGTVGLYDNNELIKIYENIVVSTLPLIDRDNLNTGIKLNDLEELRKIIEDFDG
ncbi:MAG: BofC C-terminal domain-containing protein [Clostridia bacterium]|nr:BofC C-terminal domain-containing protein [Clostridia bacterium]